MRCSCPPPASPHSGDVGAIVARGRYEHDEVSAANPSVVKMMLSRLAEIDAGISPMGAGDPTCAPRTLKPWPEGSTNPDPEHNHTMQWLPWC